MLLPSVQIIKKIRARKSTRRRSSKEERRAKAITRRRDMVKLMLVKNGTPVMRVQAPKMKGWQASPFKSHNQPHASSPTSPTMRTTTLLLVLWQKE